LPGANGARLHKRELAAVLAGDASEVGLGIFRVHALRNVGQANDPIMYTFGEEELKRVESHEYHSTLRELKGLEYALQALERGQWGGMDNLAGKRLVYQGDNQAMH
jgi:hypothetical protein